MVGSSPPAPPPSQLQFEIDSHKGAVHTAVYNSGCSYILTGGADKQIRLTNAKSGAAVKVYSGHGYEVLGIACSHDNTRIASCGGDRNVFLWDVSSGDIIRRLGGHVGKINTVAWNADASVLASGSFDTSVRLWDIKSQNRVPLQVLEEARDSITSIKIQNHLICTASVDGRVRTYDMRMGQLQIDLFDQPVTSMSFTADSSLLLVSTLDSTHRLLDLKHGTVVQSFTGHKNTNYRSQSCFGAREETVICGDEDGKVFGWDMEALGAIAVVGKLVHIATDHECSVALFCLQGTLLGKPFKAHERAILWTAHNPKDQQLVTASSDGKVKVWTAA